MRLLLVLLLVLVFAASLSLPVSTTGRSLLSSKEILSLVADTDRGVTASDATKQAVRDFIETKRIEYENDSKAADATATATAKYYLDDPNLLGNYEVSFVGEGTSQRGNPAGGNYRGFLGRLLYRTTGIYQHLLLQQEQLVVVNYIRGVLFGLAFLPLSVILYGKVLPLATLPASQRANITSVFPFSPGGAVKALFEPPLISLFDLCSVSVGPPSSVLLDTPYVDEVLRVGVGSRGSLFLFKREDEAVVAVDNEIDGKTIVSRKAKARGGDGWIAIKERRPLRGKRLGLLLLLAGGALVSGVGGSLSKKAMMLIVEGVGGGAAASSLAIISATNVARLTSSCVSVFFRVGGAALTMLGALLFGSSGGIVE